MNLCNLASIAGRKKVQVGNDQEMAQLNRNSHSKNRDWKKQNKQSDTYTKKVKVENDQEKYRRSSEQL